MNWMDKDLQKQILSNLKETYKAPVSSQYLFDKICSDNNLDALDVIVKNLEYLDESGLISLQRLNPRIRWYLVEITPKGIDYLEPDGGLSASLGVITVKLHSDSIQQLLAAKIEQANLPNEDKNKLIKTISGKFGDAFLAKLAEKAIEQIPAATVVTFIQSIIN